MTRGCQKRIIHIKETDSALFEEAYFILRSGIGEKHRHTIETQMINEADRLIKESSAFTYPSRLSRRGSFARPFAIGAAISALISITALLFVHLIF